MLLCEFCNKECKNANSLRNHQRLCKSNPNRQEMSWVNKRNSGKPGKNQYTKAKELGLPKPEISDETRLKISESSKNQIWTEERRKKLSESMKLAVKNNPDSYTSSNVCGRVKVEEYNGEKFHGKWEIEVAKWFDRNNIKWIRKIDPFNYFWNGGWHLYFPDFYLPEYNLYVEVKGYETERDRCKWSVIQNLIVLKSKEINLIKEDKFALVTHRVESAPL